MRLSHDTSQHHTANHKHKHLLMVRLATFTHNKYKRLGRELGLELQHMHFIHVGQDIQQFQALKTVYHVQKSIGVDRKHSCTTRLRESERVRVRLASRAHS